MNDSPNAGVHSMASSLRKIAMWLVPAIVYIGLLWLFVPNDPKNPTTLITVGVPYIIFLALIVIFPVIVVYYFVRDTSFVRGSPLRRILLLICSCIVPLTFEFIVGLPLTGGEFGDVRQIIS